VRRDRRRPGNPVIILGSREPSSSRSAPRGGDCGCGSVRRRPASRPDRSRQRLEFLRGAMYRYLQ
jgi:hypothetical protein